MQRGMDIIFLHAFAAMPVAVLIQSCMTTAYTRSSYLCLWLCQCLNEAANAGLHSMLHDFAMECTFTGMHNACRLQGIANDQSASRNTIIQEGQVNDRTWRQAKLQQKQLQDFKLQIADGLMCGLIVMLLGMLYFGAAFGYYDSKLELCNTRRFSFFARLWGPLDVVVCYISATMDLVGSVAAMLVTVYAVKRFGLLTDSIAKPMTGLVLFLGVGCGLLGKYVIGRLGGDSFVWLSVYEVWVFQQVLAVWFVQALHACLQADRTVWQQFRLPMYMLFTGLVMPFVVAACAFWHSLYKQAFQ